MQGTENRVFITDQDSCFYKLDNFGHLTKARSIDDAYKFTVKDANSRIGNKKKSRKFQIVDVAKFQSVPEYESVDEAQYADVGVGYSEVEYVHDDLHAPSYDIENVVKLMCDVSNNVDDQRKQLVAELSSVDLEICDIEHYLEFNEFGINEAAEVSFMLQERRRRRRAIKDDIERIDMIKDTFMDPKFKNMINTSLQRMMGLKNRHYNPRRLYELFSGGTLGSAC